MTDQAVARRLDHFDAAVEFVRLAGQQRVHRRVEAQRRGRLRDVMHLSVGDEKDAGDAVGRGIVQRRIQVGEKICAGGGLLSGNSGGNPLDIEVRNFAELGFEIVADRIHLLGAVGEFLTRALVQHDDGDVGEALALFLLEDRVEKRRDQCRERCEADQRAARTPYQQRDDKAQRDDRQHCQHRQRNERRKGNRPVQNLCLY